MSEQPNLFRESALKRASTPAELDDYIQAVRPGTWLVVAASLLAVAALLVWGVFGKVSTKVVDNGVARQGAIVCFLNADDHAQVEIGDLATVNGLPAVVAGRSDWPISAREAAQAVQDVCDDYRLSMLNLEEWNYEVYLLETEAVNPLSDGTPVQVVVTTQEIAPISFLLGQEIPADRDAAAPDIAANDGEAF